MAVVAEGRALDVTGLGATRASFVKFHHFGPGSLHRSRWWRV